MSIIHPSTSVALPSPSNPWIAHPVIIEDISPEISGVQTYHVRFQDEEQNRAYHFEPGQFNMLYLPGCGESAISLSAGPRPDGPRTWSHTVRVAGNVTRALERLGRGDSFGLRGPFGRGWPSTEINGADVIVVAGGIGLAPLRPLIYALSQNRKSYGRLILLYGARSPDTLLYTREFIDWTQQGWQIQITVDRASPDWRGNVGVVPLLLDRLRPLDVRNTAMLLCGPEVMMNYTIHSALGRGLTEKQIWLSLERNMHCAVGMCGHCQFGPVFICKDGPVFRYDEIESIIPIREM